MTTDRQPIPTEWDAELARMEREEDSGKELSKEDAGYRVFLRAAQAAYREGWAAHKAAHAHDALREALIMARAVICHQNCPIHTGKHGGEGHGMTCEEIRTALAAEQQQATDALREALVKTLAECEDSLAAIGGCEHDVNICCCGLIDTIAEAKAALAAPTHAAEHGDAAKPSTPARMRRHRLTVTWESETEIEPDGTRLLADKSESHKEYIEEVTTATLGIVRALVDEDAQAVEVEIERGPTVAERAEWRRG